jgi:predicted nucleic acid-binding protein
MVYADTSCLLKVLRPDPLSKAVWTAILAEETIVVSTLAELETLVQLKAAWTGGLLTRNEWRQAETRFNILKNRPPFDFRAPSARLFQTALRQHRNSGDVHCRSLDRMHLATMEELDITRLMTHDVSQADAAIEAGFQVICPGRS